MRFVTPPRLVEAEGILTMSPRLARRLRGAVPVIVFFVIVALTWDNVRWYLAPELGPREPLTVTFIGVLLALSLIVLESSALSERFRRLPFGATVFLKTVTYLAALTAILLGIGLMFGILEGRTFGEFVEALPRNFAVMATAFLLYGVIIFLRQLDRLLGPGVLLRYGRGSVPPSAARAAGLHVRRYHEFYRTLRASLA